MALGRNVFDPNSFLDTKIRLGPRHNEKSFPTMVTQITRSILFTGKTSTYTLACTFYREKFFLPSHISHITSTPARTFLGGKFHLPSHSRTFSLPQTCSPAKEISLAESNFQYWTLKFRNRIFSIVRLLVKIEIVKITLIKYMRTNSQSTVVIPRRANPLPTFKTLR